MSAAYIQRQYLYFCASKSRKQSSKTWHNVVDVLEHHSAAVAHKRGRAGARACHDRRAGVLQRCDDGGHNRVERALVARVAASIQRQDLYFCIRKASKLNSKTAGKTASNALWLRGWLARSSFCVSFCTFVPVKKVN
jgi:hypothetical protein